MNIFITMLPFQRRFEIKKNIHLGICSTQFSWVGSNIAPGLHLLTARVLFCTHVTKRSVHRKPLAGWSPSGKPLQLGSRSGQGRQLVSVKLQRFWSYSPEIERESQRLQLRGSTNAIWYLILIFVVQCDLIIKCQLTTHIIIFCTW